MAKFPAASRVRYMEAPIRDVLAPARELERQGHKVLKLNIGDPDAYDFVPPTPLVEALRGVADGGRYADSEGMPDVREAIARYERDVRGIQLQPQDIIFTAGVSEALSFLFGAMLEAGDEILVPGPAYPQYLGVTSFYGAVPVEYPSTPQNGWIPTIEDIAARVTPRTRAIAVITPNNPTGAVYPRETIRAIAKLAHERNLILISDDIYSELVFDGDGVAPSCAHEPGPVVILNGFSKNWLVPGWRAGYIAFKHENGELDDIKEGVMKQARSRLSASYPIQVAIAKALQARAPHIPELRRRLRERAELVVKRVSETSNLTLSAPGGAFYALVGIRGLYDEKSRGEDAPERVRIANNPWPTDKEWVLNLLKEEKVLVVHGSGFGQSAAGHFRTVILPPPETLNEAFDRIIRFANKHAK